MAYCDSHVHMDHLTEIEAAIMVARALTADVRTMIAVGGSAAANRRVLDAARQFPREVFAAVGFDREHAAAAGTCGADLEAALSGGLPPVAVGEIGLDFHYRPETAAAQCELFRAQLAIAALHAMPVIVHSRDADAETIDALKDHAAGWKLDPARIGVVHCFTGGVDFALALLDLGFCVSFSGIVTFKNAAALREVAALVPEDRLMIETDTPYLSPEPVRGDRNEPRNLRHVAASVAAVRGRSVEDVAELTRRNALHLFGLAP